MPSMIVVAMNQKRQEDVLWLLQDQVMKFLD